MTCLAVAVLVSFRIPVGEYRGVHAEAMQFSNLDPSHVYAVAVTEPEVSYGTLWFMQHDLMRSSGKTLQQHIDDPDARESREEGWAAAHMAIGQPVTQWMVSDESANAVGQLFSDVACADETCTATVVNGNIVDVGKQAGDRVSFKEPPPGVLVPDVTASWGTAPPVGQNLAGWTGGSAGLAYSLAYVEYLTGHAVTPTGLTVAATGHISVTPTGRAIVGEIAGVEAKVESATLVEADVLFVPPGQAIPGAEVPMVEVESVFGALEWLCRNGSSHPRCTPDGQWDPR